MSDLLKKLEAHLAEMEISATELQKNQLVGFVEQLHKWNKAYNLTSVRDPMEMITRHISDSVALLKLLPQQQNYIDVGTGPGLPGVPLAIMMPDSQFVLLDSLGKRTRFIQQTIFELGIKNVKPVQSRVEDFIPENKFDGVLSRAFASLEDMLTWCQHLVKPETGRFFAMKGIYPSTEIDTLAPEFELEKVSKLNVPQLNEERHLVEIKLK
ncbi:16S rRNA (guanine(527)-N(7))-methyltransferase RsmG [Catenovulum sp. 2E275]|uniref:16S rRNA (guanine(527)-N(7))-methyltransferase RsmG n=1 Tax=Catenovulum sp. 2E275 TaxID=2980497 RepID=UPI0021CE0B60|nr:16S rRNA (guanine(527)-N(7))-methyltransferase RsmG [Catenovulum sp. 2E275]MCU4676234.1 16S rRNA (guanine(527)-N(7))-methyltransferase RsmG [Catenovulum sp. 2E275]